MLIIPTIIGFIISAVLFNFSFVHNRLLGLNINQAQRNLTTGRVLGVSEKMVRQGKGGLSEQISANDTGRMAAALLDEVRNLPLKSFNNNDTQVNFSPVKLKKTIPNLKNVKFNLDANNGAVLDIKNNQFIYRKNADQPRPIASVTKLITALVFLDFNPGWDKQYAITPDDKRDGGRVYLFTGDKITIKDLFNFSLVGSDNIATIALVHAAGFKEGDFVDKMNQKMKALGFKNTHFADAIGLNSDNVSTAEEIARLAQIALSNNYIIKATISKKYEFTTSQDKKKIINSTNELINFFPWQDITLLGGKTGHIDAAGYCFVSKFKNGKDREIISVVLGAKTDADRFKETKGLVKAAYLNLNNDEN